MILGVFLALLSTLSGGSTEEFCASPVEGGRGEPAFCRLAEPQRLQTPYFCLDVPAHELVGVKDEGRVAIMQPTIRQSPIGVRIESIAGDEMSAAVKRLVRACAGANTRQTPTMSNGELFCELGDPKEIVTIHRVIFADNRAVVIHLSSGSLASSLLESYRQTVRSVVPASDGGCRELAPQGPAVEWPAGAQNPSGQGGVDGA